MPPVEPLGVLAFIHFMPRESVGSGVSRTRMEVIGHECVGMNDPAEAPDGLDEDGEELQISSSSR